MRAALLAVADVVGFTGRPGTDLVRAVITGVVGTAAGFLKSDLIPPSL